MGFTFGIAPKVTKSLGLKPPKAEKPGNIPKIRKLATLKQYGFFNGIPPGFSPAERFFRQRPGITGVTRGAGVPPYGGTIHPAALVFLHILITYLLHIYYSACFVPLYFPFYQKFSVPAGNIPHWIRLYSLQKLLVPGYPAASGY